MSKITIVGDIMCEPLLLKAAKIPGGYDFSPMYANIREMFQQSDFVIGNLETPLAGNKAGYVKELFSFNAPVEFALAAKEAGISLVSTANNHCMDRGFDGLIETVKSLDDIGLAHIGTYVSPEENHRTYYCDIDGTAIAVIAYTYGTNYSIHHRAMSREQEQYVNLLRPSEESVFLRQTKKKPLPEKVADRLLRGFKREDRAAIKKALGMSYNFPRKDDAVNLETAAPYLMNVQRDICEAKEKADIVLFIPHIGGQFHPEPGAFTEKVIQLAEKAGADAIIASHPHIVQKAEIHNGIPCFFSIGNFSMSPNSAYLLHENLPDYGLAVNLYVEHKSIVKTTFTILKIIEKDKLMLSVYPVDQLSEPSVKDIKHIYRTVTGRDLSEPIIRSEYEL